MSLITFLKFSKFISIHNRKNISFLYHSPSFPYQPLQSPLPKPLSTLPPTFVIKEKSIAAFGNDLLTVDNYLLTVVNVFLALATMLLALATIPACLSKYTYLP